MYSTYTESTDYASPPTERPFVYHLVKAKNWRRKLVRDIGATDGRPTRSHCDMREQRTARYRNAFDQIVDPGCTKEGGRWITATVSSYINHQF